jgi:shikimate kinase
MSEEPQAFCLFMIGPMGSGKSTVGRHLASLLHCDFVDSDAEIETRAGADIPWIFDVEGEDGFRRREASVLQELSEQTRVVIATGGGAVVTAANRELMSRLGVVIYLDVSVAQQVKRTGSGGGRPLLQGGDRQATLGRLMAEREPLYRELADVIISDGGSNARKVARQIQQALEDRGLLVRGAN